MNSIGSSYKTWGGRSVRSFTRGALTLGLLLTLGAAHPSQPFAEKYKGCDVWTNWTVLCSRIGSSGLAKCRRDRRVRVAPSAMFCVSGKWTGLPWYIADETDQQKSRLRFCEVMDAEPFGKKRVPICRQYKAQRPFNGTRIETQNELSCDVVGMANTSAPVCHNGGADDQQSCNRVEKTFRASYPLYCARWNANAKCRLGKGKGDVLPGTHEPAIFPNRTLTGTAVWAPLCSNP